MRENTDTSNYEIIRNQAKTGVTKLKIELLSNFQLSIDANPITSINTSRLQALIAYLVLRRGVSQSRQQLAFQFWPESTETQARTNLRSLLHRLRIALPQAHEFLILDQQSIEWRANTPGSLDVADFEIALTEANRAELEGDKARLRSELERAIKFYQGDLLPDCYDEWILPYRERLKQLAIICLERLIKLLEHGRDYETAISYGRHLLRLDPLHESTYLSLIRLYAAQGERPSALRVYHSCATILKEELGAEPGPAICAAYEQLLSANNSLPIPVSTFSGDAPLVGRHPEWARLQAVWEATANGRPRMVIISGEAGIGKTRLAQQLLSWSHRQGIITAIARSYAAEGELAYAPVVEWLGSEVIKPGLEQLEEVWKSEIARLLPDLLIQYPDLKPAGPLTESWQRQRLFEALARGFLKSNKPLLLLLDDLQWCDRDTLEWLHFLLRYKSQIRLMVIGTVRTEETRTNTSLTVLLDQLRSSNQLTEIELEPLSKTETAELAVQLARRTLTEEVLNELYSETEGNPLFVVEMVRAGLPDRATQNAGIKANPIPAGLQAVITYQLNQVGSESREVLRLASVIGRSFTFKVLERAAEGSQDVILRSLEDLWQRQIVREEGAESYYFSHEKLRAVAYAELSGVRRKVLHQRVAEALKSEYSLNLDSVSGQIASHYEQGGLVANAVEFYQRAANVNQRLFANSEAIDYLRRALKLLITGQLPNVNVTAALLNERLGDLLHMIGRYGEARSCYETALGYYPEQERLPRTQLQRRIGNTWRDQYHYEEAFAACTAAETTLGLTSTENDIQIWQCWSQIQMDRMQTHYWLGQASEMEEIGKTAWPIVEKYGSPLQLARMYQFRAIAGLRRDRYVPTPEVVAVSRQFLKEVEKLNDTTTRPSALFQLGFTLLFHNDLDEAEKYLQEALTLSEHTGDVSLEGRCLTYCTILFRKRGQIEAVREFAGRSLELATTNLMYDYIGAASGNLAWLAWRDNRLSDAQVQGERALEAWDRTALAFSSQWTALWPLIGVALAEKRPDSVAKYVALLLAPQQQQPPLILETALEAVLHAAKLGETEKVLSSLVEVRDLAHSLGYL